MKTLICLPNIIGVILLLLLLLVLLVGYIGGVVMSFKKSTRDGFIILGIGALGLGFFMLINYLLSYPCP